MQKIEIEFKNQTLKIYLIVKEKNLDNTLLNTNIISNEKLLFSLDYIAKNQKLVSSFLKEICLEKNTNLIVANDMNVISTVAPCFKNTPINKVLMNTNENFTYEAYEAISKINSLKEVECLSIPTYLIELFDKQNIKVISKQEVLFSSQFMANNDLNNYSAIFYAKTIKLMCPIVTNDYNDLKTFFKINKYLKTIELYRFLTTDLLALIDLLTELRVKNVTIAIHDNITDKDIIERIKVIKKENKKYHLNIILAYSSEYIESNYIKQLIATTVKSCCLIIILLSFMAFAFVFYNNKKSLENVNAIKDNITEYLDTKIKDNDTDETPTFDDNNSNENPSNPDIETPDNNTDDNQNTDNPDNNETPTPVVKEKNPVIMALKDLNSDTVGWLNVPETTIDYPIVQATDNEYYLKHNFNTYNDVNNEMKWEVFAAYTIPVTDDYLKTNFSNQEEFFNFINLIRSRSIFKSDIEINADDKILTLSTCANTQDRFVVHAVLRKDLLKED